MYLLFRDAERQDRVTLASCGVGEPLLKNQWTFTDLTTDAVGSWEPSVDLGLWTRAQVLNIFVQQTDQLDGGDATNRTDNIPPTPVRVIEVKP